MEINYGNQLGAGVDSVRWVDFLTTGNQLWNCSSCFHGLSGLLECVLLEFRTWVCVACVHSGKSTMEINYGNQLGAGVDSVGWVDFQTMVYGNQLWKSTMEINYWELDSIDHRQPGIPKGNQPLGNQVYEINFWPTLNSLLDSSCPIVYGLESIGSRVECPA